MSPSNRVLPLRLAEFRYPTEHPRHGTAGVVYGYVVRSPHGCLLFDTGIGPPHPEIDAYYAPRRVPLDRALRDQGLGLDDVTAVANSHLHFDHCGGNARFPGLPIYVQRREREAARAPNYTVREWVDFPGADYRVVEGDVELGDGIRLLDTRGHTPGHQSLSVPTESGLTVLAGHAIFSAAEYRGRAAPESSTDEDRRAAERLRALDPARVYFSHDEDVYDRAPSRGR